MKVEIHEARGEDACLHRHAAPVRPREGLRRESIHESTGVDEERLVARLPSLGIHHEGAHQRELVQVGTSI
jgi:hypothetical protein